MDLSYQMELYVCIANNWISEFKSVLTINHQEEPNMGRQLAFWKYEDGVYLDNKEVYKKSFGDGEEVSGLSELPKEH